MVNDKELLIKRKPSIKEFNFWQIINFKKTTIIIALSVLAIILMLFPVANGSVDPVLVSEKLAIERTDAEKSSQISISILNASKAFSDIKETFGLDTISTEGIDINHPSDDNEKTTIILSKVVGGFDLAIALSYLALFLLFVGMMVVFVKPNSIANPILFSASGLLLLLAGFFSFEANKTATQNISLIGDYFGFIGTTETFSFVLNQFFIVPIIFCFFISAVSIILKTPLVQGDETETLSKIIFFGCAAASVLSVFLVCLFLFSKGIPTIAKIGFFDFIFGSSWQPNADIPQFGIFNLILTSLVGMLGAVIIGVPVGILVAVCISKMSPKWLSKILRPTIDLLAGIPSVVYGAVGAILLVPFIMNSLHLPTGATLLSAIIVLSIMVLPTIISVSEVSIRAVPESYMEGALALGATKERAIFKVLIPAARSGIMAGVLLGLGRAIGEAMAIILVAGNVPIFPELFKPARFLTTGIVAEMGYATGLHKDALFAIGMVLFVFILILNSVFHSVMKKAGAKYE